MALARLGGSRAPLAALRTPTRLTNRANLRSLLCFGALDDDRGTGLGWRCAAGGRDGARPSPLCLCYRWPVWGVVCGGRCAWHERHGHGVVGPPRENDEGPCVLRGLLALLPASPQARGQAPSRVEPRLGRPVDEAASAVCTSLPKCAVEHVVRPCAPVPLFQLRPKLLHSARPACVLRTQDLPRDPGAPTGGRSKATWHRPKPRVQRPSNQCAPKCETAQKTAAPPIKTWGPCTTACSFPPSHDGFCCLLLLPAGCRRRPAAAYLHRRQQPGYAQPRATTAKTAPNDRQMQPNAPNQRANSPRSKAPARQRKKKESYEASLAFDVRCLLSSQSASRGTTRVAAGLLLRHSTRPAKDT